MRFALPLSRGRWPLLAAFLATVASLLVGGAANAQTLGMFLSPPGEQNTTRPGATVEDFSGATGAIGATGLFTVGAWSGATGGVTRNAADQFGGAGGAGQYLALSSGNQVTITLATGRKYVGFWWSAGNAGNAIEFYDDADNLLASFTTNSLTTLLSGGGNITAIDGSPYAKSAYFGNPNPPSGRNAAQPYGYINLLLQGASVNFRKIIIRHAGGGAFELDNLAVVDAATAPGAWVDLGTLPVTLPASAIGTQDDSATTPFNTPVGGNVATNDTTVPGSTFAVLAAPANGSVVLQEDDAGGSATVTQGGNFNSSNVHQTSVASVATVDQSGSNNTADLTQGRSAGNAFQTNGQQALITQSGNSNRTTASQTGSSGDLNVL